MHYEKIGMYFFIINQQKGECFMELVLVHIGKEDRKLSESQTQSLKDFLNAMLQERFCNYAALPSITVLHDPTQYGNILAQELCQQKNKNWNTHSNPLLHAMDYGLMGGIDGVIRTKETLLNATWKARYYALLAAVGFIYARMPFGESHWQMTLRMRQFVSELVNTYADVKIVLCRSDVFDALASLLGIVPEQDDLPLGMTLYLGNRLVTDGRTLLNGQHQLFCGLEYSPLTEEPKSKYFK